MGDANVRQRLYPGQEPSFRPFTAMLGSGPSAIPKAGAAATLVA
jgi:hypothetical protein